MTLNARCASHIRGRKSMALKRAASGRAAVTTLRPAAGSNPCKLKVFKPFSDPTCAMLDTFGPL